MAQGAADGKRKRSAWLFAFPQHIPWPYSYYRLNACDLWLGKCGLHLKKPTAQAFPNWF